MEEQFLDNDFQEETTGGIPKFLKVLCILTFVGAGLGILMGLFNIFNFDNAIKALEIQSEALRNTNNPFGDMDGIIQATKDYGMMTYIVALIGNLLCLAGALMMWKLKKTGFYLYSIGEIAPLGASLVMISNMPSGNDMMSTFTTLGFVITAIFYLAFVIMYAVNLKHLK